jgi:uncharacterized protein YbjT (DUF2867 family)
MRDQWYGAVNVVSLYVEHGRETFHSVHVESAQRIAIQAQRAGVERLIHVSGIGADHRSQSTYIRKRGEGELAVRAAFADALLIRPAVMFGLDDALLTTVATLLKRLPVFSDVWPRPNAIAASLCRRCSGGGRDGVATGTDAPHHVRMRRALRLFLRGTPQGCRPRS